MFTNSNLTIRFLIGAVVAALLFLLGIGGGTGFVAVLYLNNEITSLSSDFAALSGPARDHAMQMFKDSVDAYMREDVELARGLKARDRALDELNGDASRRFIERMAQDPEQLRGYLNLMFIARHLERVGDHATNIAEDAVYAAAAEDIRHQGPQAA